jgi:hypothetical protein
MKREQVIDLPFIIPWNRNRFSMGLVFVALLTSIVVCVSSARADDVVLQDSKVLVAFDSLTGALTRFENKLTHWVIERRPELGASFRILVPLLNQRYNFVLGVKQHASKVDRVSEKEVRIEWKNLTSEHGGLLPISFTATVTLNDGVLQFRGTLTNNSELVVETVDYPYFGDFNPPTRETPLHARTMRYDNLQSFEIYPHLVNEKGYWGVFYPTKTLESKYSLFCLIQAPDQGMYVEMHNSDAPYLLQYTFEQHPGLISGINSLVPQENEISGTPVHLEFRTCHFVFAHPHSTVTLVPVVLRCYSGDWHAGVDLYKEWRATWYKPHRVPEWAQQIHSWQQLQVNTPEQNYRVRYTDLVKFGEECAKNGVHAIQLVGWNDGGQDGGNPSLSTDPGLGTWQDLHDAIAGIQSMGVHIVLFGKFPWADMTAEWYKRELYKYACTDPYGIPYVSGGYSYLTPTQLAAINNHRMAVMDFLCPAYRDVAATEFQKVLDLGADGFLYDEICVRPVEYNFAPGHGYDPPGYIHLGDAMLAAQFHAEADKVNRNFLFAGECPQDWLTQYYPFSYNRGSETPAERYIDPYAPILVAVNGFDDRERLNMILMQRCLIEYEPYNFKGHLSDFPLTLAYGKKINALRKRYKPYLWDAEYRDTIGATVTADGSCQHSVFVTAAGKRAVVVVNAEPDKMIAVTVEIPNAGTLVVATPEHQETSPSTGRLKISPRSVAVLMER